MAMCKECGYTNKPGAMKCAHCKAPMPKPKGKKK